MLDVFESLTPEVLRMIHTHCCNLQGLNLQQISTTRVYICILKAWEVLSSMNLTYLHIDISFIGDSLKMDNACKKQLIALFKQCTTLQALELSSDPVDPYTDNVYDKPNSVYELLSYFPSLEYCKLNGNNQSTAVQDILTTCKNLRYFYCISYVQLSLPSVHINLQQLHLSSGASDLNDNFMDAVSAQGGLIHVFFFINSVTSKGITTLIENSPTLLTFVCLHQKKGISSSLGSLLEKKFAHRKLFNSGLFGLLQVKRGQDLESYLCEMQNGCSLSDWPPKQFCDLLIRERFNYV